MEPLGSGQEVLPLLYYEGYASHTRLHLTYIAFSICLVLMIVVERLVSAILTLLARLILGPGTLSRSGCVDEPMGTVAAQLRQRFGMQGNEYLDMLDSDEVGSSNALEGYASMQLVGATTSFASAIAASLTQSIVDAAVSLSSYVIWVAAVTLVFSLLYLVQENYSEALLEAVDQWNKGYAPFVYKMVFIPMQFVDVVFSSLVPLYNAFVWLIKQLLNNVFLDSLIANLGEVAQIGKGVASLCKHAALEVAPYITKIVTVCDYAKQGDLCYEAGNGRVIDFITMMADVRSIAASLARVSLGICARGAAPVNIMLFPFMDINFAKGLHNVLNSVLYTVFQLPTVTAQRCINHGPNSASNPGGAGAGSSILMCLPDFNQPLNMLVQGIRNMGVMVDNWLDVTSIIGQRALGLLSAEEAIALDCKANAKSLNPAFYLKSFFDGSETTTTNRHKIVVGLTEGLYAVTDGRHAQYFNHYDSVESMASPYVWPIDVDTRFGVAAVTYGSGSGAEDRDGVGEDTTTMLGCRCTDNNGLPPIRIHCALALKSAAAMSAAAAAAAASKSSTGNSDNNASSFFLSAPDTTFEVVFQQRSTANYMTCAMAQISVQSVRWPATRFSGR